MLPRARNFILIAVTGLLCAAVQPGVASAASYDVHACNAAVAGGANNSFAPVANSGMAAYSDCPAGQGIVARTVFDNGTSGAFEGGYMIFDAPSGTTIEAITFEPGLEWHNCSYTVGLVASELDLAGRLIWGRSANTACDLGQTPGTNNFFPAPITVAVGAPRVRVETRCGAGSCPRNGVAAFRIRNVRVKIADNAGPSLAGGRGNLWTSDGWLSGTQSVGFDAADGSGIRDISVRVDGQEVAQRSLGCDYTQRAPCPSASIETPLNTAGWGGDGQHNIALVAVDAAGNTTVSDRNVKVDNTAPDAPIDVTVAGGDGWRSANDFDVSWKVGPQGNGAPIAAAEYEICSVGAEKDCTRGSVGKRDIASLEDVRVPSPGEYKLRVWLRDEAGNNDQRLAAPEQTLRYDDASPELAFDPLTADDPTRLAVRTTDKGSGVVSGLIELRRKGSEQWTALPTMFESGQLVARLDDEQLADGAYDLRARATDAAGNERSTDRRADGALAEFVLPLRLKTTLKGGVIRKRGKREILASTARVRYGQLVRVRGILTSREGNPMQDVEVQAFTQIQDGVTPERLLATVKTSRTGRFSFLVRKGPSRSIRLRYGGTSQVRSATRVIGLSVKSDTTIEPSRRRFVNGQSVRFAGRVKTGRIPKAGKLMELQVVTRGRWRTFATTRTGPRGTWRYNYRFDGTRGRVTYRFRARVPRETGYPYVTGESRQVRVSVRGV